MRTSGMKVPSFAVRRSRKNRVVAAVTKYWRLKSLARLDIEGECAAGQGAAVQPGRPALPPTFMPLVRTVWPS